MAVTVSTAPTATTAVVLVNEKLTGREIKLGKGYKSRI